MKRITMFSARISLLIILLASMYGFTQPVVVDKVQSQASPAKYTVLVGAEDNDEGVDAEYFYPATLHIHVGDTVVWKQNSAEIHNVAFLAGSKMPDLIVPAPAGAPSPVMFNPKVTTKVAPLNGKYDGAKFANSGLMGFESGQERSFTLIFTKAGAYKYVCIVHGEMMSGTIVVEKPNIKIPSPDQVKKSAKNSISLRMSKADAAIKAVEKRVPPPVLHKDGTTTYRILVGASGMGLDLMRFFPDKLTVRPGDTIIWVFPRSNMAPHTITFLNGTEEPEIVIPMAQKNGPPLLLINPKVLMPTANIKQPLTGKGYINSGFLEPSTDKALTTFRMKVGKLPAGENDLDLDYICILHDENGMNATLKVTSKK